jgi:hypothetical protein
MHAQAQTTATQLSLFAAVVEPEYAREMTITERFEAFHAANPHVAALLADMALALRHGGRTHYGIKALVEVLRFQYAVQTRGDAFKINNDFTAHYARLLMREHPELEGFFETREIRAS